MSKRERRVWLVVFATVAAFVAVRLYVFERDLRESERADRELLESTGAKYVASQGNHGLTPLGPAESAVLHIGLVLGTLAFALLLRWFLVLQRRERSAEAPPVEPP